MGAHEPSVVVLAIASAAVRQVHTPGDASCPQHMRYSSSVILVGTHGVLGQGASVSSCFFVDER